MKVIANCSYGKEVLKSCELQYESRVDEGQEDQVINLYPDVFDQQFEGFGGAITDAAGYVFQQMNEDQQEKLLDTYFNSDSMNYELVRIHMDSCDFSTDIYSAKEEEKQEYSFADTDRYIIPLLDAAEKKAGRKLKLMLSPWSPPAYMKTNGNRLGGGSLKPEYRKAWADYICWYILTFKERGYEVVRISVQNEPKAVQTWDSCVYSAGQEKEFLRDYLYPALVEAKLQEVEVFIWDHNKERLYERARDIIDHETAEMVTGLAFHWYSGDHFEALDLVRKAFPGKKLILSESCLEFCKYDDVMEAETAGRLAHDMIGNLNGGMEAFYDWNILLDEQGGPNHVGNYCDAPFLYHRETGVLEERRILRYYYHFAHFIKAKATRIAHTKYTDMFDVTAWKNPDGEIVLIVLNRTDTELPYWLRMNHQIVKMKSPAYSITSAVIRK